MSLGMDEEAPDESPEKMQISDDTADHHHKGDEENRIQKRIE